MCEYDGKSPGTLAMREPAQWRCPAPRKFETDRSSRCGSGLQARSAGGTKSGVLVAGLAFGPLCSR